MKRIRTLVLSFLLVCAVLFVPFAGNSGYGVKTAAAAEESTTDYSTKYVVLSLEGFTIGQGFYITPTRMSYEEIGNVWKQEGIDIDLSKLTVSQATYAFFKKAGIQTTPAGANAYNNDSFYLSDIKGIDKGTANVPAYLLDAYKKVNESELELEKNADSNLGEFDYTSQSGWMNTVDNVMGDTGAGTYLVDKLSDADTHVIRWQFTIAGYGADLGYGYGSDPYYVTQDKTELYTLYAENEEEIAKDASLNAELQAVMTDLTASSENVEKAVKKIKALNEKQVEITMTAAMPYMTLTDADGNPVAVGEPDSKHVYTLGLKKGTYRLSAYKLSGTDKIDMGSVDLVVTDEAEQKYTMLNITFYCNNSYKEDNKTKYWTADEDYKISASVVSSGNVDRHATAALLKAANADKTSYAQYTIPCYYGDEVSAVAAPIGSKADGYLTGSTAASVTFSRTLSVAIPDRLKATIHVPHGADLRVGTLSKYFIYKDMEADSTDTSDVAYDTYEYTIGSNITYYYRVSGAGGVTYWNWFSVKADVEYTVTADDMHIGDASYRPDTIYHDLSKNKYDVADIYLTSNEQGYLSMQKGDIYHLECFRNWQTIEGISNAKSAEPDYHYTVIDENGNPSDAVITVTPGAHTEQAEIQAKSEGTAILLVTYDAQINKASSTFGGTDFSAIWPENTGVVVVTVGKDGTGIQTNMTINAGKNAASEKMSGDKLDAQLDVLYYAEGTTGAEYTFAPESNVAVSVLRPEIENDKLTYGGFSTKDIVRNKDGSYTIKGLVEGPNIVKVTKNGVSTYQVIRAKEVEVSYAYKDAQGNAITEDELTAGSTIEITYGSRSTDGKRAYDGIYIPANKLAGIYNMSGTLCLTDEEGNQYKGTGNQYLFAYTPVAQTVKVTIPVYYSKDTIRLSGVISESGFGSAYGAHRLINRTTGETVKMNAIQHTAVFGKLPEVEYKLVKQDFVNVNLNITDSQTKKPVEKYTITVKDEKGKQTTVTDGRMVGFAGQTYSYVIKAAGYLYKEGSFVIPEDTESMTKSIRLDPASGASWDGSSEQEPAQIDGVYQIGTGAELYWFAKKVKTTGSINAVLTADIDLAGYEWSPITPSSSSIYYSGTFDGQGHTVKNLSIHGVANSGLFGQVSGQIRNLTVEGQITLNTATKAGGIAAVLRDNNSGQRVSVSNCTSKVDITYAGTNSYVYAGGIVGYCNTKNTSENVIENCINYGTVTVGNGSSAGGILGAMVSCNVTVQNCSNYGAVTGTDNIGGILGRHSVDVTPGDKIINCYNAGVVTGQGKTGGIAGSFAGKAATKTGAEIRECYNAGTVANSVQYSDHMALTGAVSDITLSGNVYSNTDEAGAAFTAEEASYVAASDIAAVKKLTTEAISKKTDKEQIERVAPVVEILAKVPLSEEDQAFVDLYQDLKTEISKQKTVKVGIYDYAAAKAGIKGASENGVILAETEIDAATAAEAVEKALKQGQIPYVLTDTQYGPYMESINGLSVQADYTMSGWMFSYNYDDFTNMGMSATDIKDGDVLEFHYQLTGEDVASGYSGLPTLKTLTVGGNAVKFAVESTYDANWNQIITYKADGKELAGNGTETDPFIINIDLLKGTDVSQLPVSYETEAESHYVTVDGLADTMDLTEAVTFHVTSRAGRNAWYKLTAEAKTDKKFTKDNTKVVIADAAYTGNDVTPDVTVSVNGNAVAKDQYDVSFADNKNAGTATCTVTGKGEFTGEVQQTFEIRKAEQQITNVPEDQKVVYGQQETIAAEAKAETAVSLSSDQESVVSVTEDGKLQINGIGTAVITIAAAEGDNYLAAESSFKITVIGDMSKVTVAPVASVEYTGIAIIPELTITDGAYTLVPDVDYTLSCRNNRAVGTATVTISGKEDRYTGSATVTFEITKAKQEIVVDAKTIEVTEGAEPFVLSADGHGTLTFTSSSPNVADVDETGFVTVKAAGFTDIRIQTAGTTNYEAAETVVRLTVKKKTEPENPEQTTETPSTTEKPKPEDPSATEEPTTEQPTTESPKQVIELTSENTKVNVSSVTYNGKEQKPAVQVTVASKELSAADYTVAYTDNKNAGTAKVTITGKGNYTGQVTGTFQIKKADQQIKGQRVYVYGTHVAVKAETKGTASYTSSNKKIAAVNKKSGFVTAKKPGKVQIKVTAAATANYKKSTGTITLIVIPATPTVKKTAAYKTKALQISYKKVSGASGYQVTYADNKAFKNAKSIYVNSKKSSAVIKKLKKQKKYYVKVRSYKKINGKKYYSVYSKTKTVKTK